MAATRILLLLPGIGPVRAGRMVEALLESGGQLSAWNEIKPPPPSEEIWPDLLKLLKRLAGDDRCEQNVSAELHQVRRFYTPLLESRYDHAAARLRDLDELCR